MGVEAVSDERVGDVPAIPSQKEICAVNARCSQMVGVATRDRWQNADCFGLLTGQRPRNKPAQGNALG